MHVPESAKRFDVFFSRFLFAVLQVCFLETKFDFLFAVNFVVNIIFLIDMGLQFVLMYPTKSPYARLLSALELESGHVRVSQPSPSCLLTG